MTNKKTRVSFYIDEELYLKLRAQLIVRRKPVSVWLRERIKRYVEGNNG
jgi:hypothetical protein